MRTRPITIAALVGATTLIPITAHAGTTAVVAGEFETLGGGSELGYSVDGVARMVRASGDRTIVTVHVRGLDANTTFPVHVHDAPCAASPPGGGHYQHAVGGPVDADNEIWPTVRTGPTGIGLGIAHHSHIARDDARAVVIHHPADTSIRLACADLD